VPAQRKDNRDQPPCHLGTAEVAALLHVSPKTVARWAKEGKLPLSLMRTLGGHRRYPEPSSATSWISSGRNRRPEPGRLPRCRGPAAIGGLPTVRAPIGAALLVAAGPRLRPTTAAGLSRYLPSLRIFATKGNKL
jgi:hypothetical protein